MASLELMRLWKLAQIDNSIADIKHRAASLDVGKDVMALLATLEEEEKVVGGKARALHSEVSDLELINKGNDDKIKRLTKDLYGGRLNSPKEIESFEKEIVMLKKQREKNDEKLLELWEELPPAQAAAKAIEAKIADAKKTFAERRKSALAKKAELEADYAKLLKARPDAEKLVEKSLLARYEGIRARSHGVGMCGVYKGTQCAGCGTNLPTRSIEHLKDDRIVTCEACHRILYSSTGAI